MFTSLLLLFPTITLEINHTIINIQILYENEKVSVVDEYGRPEAMDSIVDKDQLCLQCAVFISTVSVERERGRGNARRKGID